MNLYNEKNCKYLMYLDEVLNEEEKSIRSHLIHKVSNYAQVLNLIKNIPNFI